MTPITPAVKRLHAETSPNEKHENAVGAMNPIDLMEMMQMSMAKLFDEKLKGLATKEDLDVVKTKVDTFTTKINDVIKENQILKEKVRVLEEDKNKDHVTIVRLEEHIKRKNIIIRGVCNNKSIYEAVDGIIKENLKIKTPIEFESIRKIYENNEKRTVVAELKTERMIQEILKHTGNLKGTSISIELDLGSERLQDKKVMMQLKRDILFINKSKRVSVRNDKMKIENKWFYWNKNKELTCEGKKAEDTLHLIYGDVMHCLDIVYNNILSKIISKN